MSLPHLVSSVREVVKRDRFLRMHAVEDVCGIRKSTIYTLMAKQPPEFPRSVQITPRCVAWSEQAVLQWVQDKITGADQLPLDATGGTP